MNYGPTRVRIVLLKYDSKELEPILGYSNTMLSEAQWYSNTMLSACGFSAYRMVFGSYQMDLFGREDQHADLMFAQDTSLPGQFVQQWKLRMRPQEATLKEIANAKVRCPMAQNKSSNCADMPAGDSVLFSKAESEKLASLLRTREDSGY